MDARLFTDYLREIDRGRLLEELSIRTEEIVQAIFDTGKKGAITLKLDIKPSQDAETVVVKTTVKIEKPGPDIRPALYFITEEANLSRRDPRQGDLEDVLHAVDTEGGRQANGD